MEKEKHNIGVIVARYQVDELTIGHKQVIDQVVNNHNKVIIFLGIARAFFTQNNPLEFIIRKFMLEKEYPTVQIMPLKDVGDDEKWSKVLDERIREVYPHGEVVLYGGRDSFIPHYKGKFNTKEIEPTHVISGTIMRKKVSDEILKSTDFRRGIIYACNNKYPTGYPTIDVAPTKYINGELHVLLCKKPNEDKFRFIGGFFDPEKDRTFEQAAERELLEETTGCKLHNFYYVTNMVIDDPRYRGEKDKIITTMFTGEYAGGELIPADDVSELKWFKVHDNLFDEVMNVHVNLCIELLDFLKGDNYKKKTIINN